MGVVSACACAARKWGLALIRPLCRTQGVQQTYHCPPAEEMGARQLVALILFIAIQTRADGQKDTVPFLTEHSFTETVKEADFIVVEFFAPW